MVLIETELESPLPTNGIYQPKTELWELYFKDRFPDAFEASNLTRNQPPETRRSYLNALGIAADELESLGCINSSKMTEDESEVMLAVCDSWVSNNILLESPLKDQTEEFLTKIAREVGGYRYRDLGREKKRHERAKLNPIEWAKRVMLYKNETLTAQLDENLKRRDRQSFIYQARQLLDIAPDASEQSFTTLVLDLSRIRRGSELSDWENVTEEPNSRAFVGPVWQYGPRTMVFPAEDVRHMFRGEAAENKAKQQLAAHEYFHTQRSLLVGNYQSLGITLDEFAANKVSGYNCYPEAMLIMGLAHGFSGWEFYSKFLKNIQTPNNNAELYQYISDKLGFKSLLYLLCSAPEIYEGEGFDIPSMRITPFERNQNIILDLADQAFIRNPNIAKDWANTAPPEEARYLFDKSYESGDRMPDFLSWALCQRLLDHYFKVNKSV